MKLIKLIALAAILVIAGFFVTKNRNANNETPKRLEAQTNNQGNVEVKVEPLDVTKSSQNWKFKITLDTHSVELDYDLTKKVTLVDEQGKELKPITWEGAGPGGHHREGTLKFRAVTPRPRLIELKIIGVGGVKERSFKWQL